MIGDEKVKGGYLNYPEDLICDCGSKPILVWHYIKGTANRIHYFIKCPDCRVRTIDRKRVTGAIESWTNKQYRR